MVALVQDKPERMLAHLREVTGEESGKLLLRPEEVAHALSISRTSVYDYCAAGILPSIKLGRALRIPVGRLREWIEEHSEGGR